MKIGEKVKLVGDINKIIHGLPDYLLIRKYIHNQGLFVITSSPTACNRNWEISCSIGDSTHFLYVDIDRMKLEKN